MTAPPDPSPADAEASPLTETIAQDTEAVGAARALLGRSAKPPQPPGYDIGGLIGRGAFGAVWQATQTNTGRTVAIKHYDRRQADWPLMAREVEKLASLDSARNIVRLIEVGWDDEQPWFVMERLTGGSLADRVRQGPLPVETAVRLASEIARGLRQAHAAGVLHCDLKPGNVLLDADDIAQAEARLCDFGQARLATDESPALGTLYYMAPEQVARDARPDARWDVFAFGAVLHEMLTGRPPHRTRQTDAELAALPQAERLAAYRRLAEQTPPRLDERGGPVRVDRDLADLVADCLQPNPAERVPNAQVILDRLAARERRQSRRPLVRLGLLAPLLFSALMFVVARRAIPQAVVQAERSLARQTLTGDQLSARLLAAGLQQDLDMRLAELVELSDEPDLVDRLAAEDRERLQSRLERMQSRSDQQLRSSQRRNDTSWFLTDAIGTQVARVPKNDTIGQRFQWRDYFHGQGFEMDPQTAPDDVPPRERPGLSTPFRSRATGQYMVALAVPVRGDDGRVVGLLARTVHLYQLLDAWEQRLQSDHSPAPRLLALADTEDGELRRLLDHRWITTAEVRQHDDEEMRQLLAFPSGTPVFQISASYDDPIGRTDPAYREPWLAATAPVGETGWLAIVQERREPVLEPVEAVRDVFLHWGLILLGLFAALLLGLWAWLGRLAR